MRVVARDHPALVLVDYQQRLMPAIADVDAVLGQAIRLARIARMLSVAVLCTEQNPASLGHSVAAIREVCGAALAKSHFDACADGLVERLDAACAAPVPHVVVAGCESHVCLMQTALGLLEAGRRVFVATDACGSRRAADHRLAMRRLERAGATLVSVEMIAFEWLETSDNAAFRDVLALIK